MGRPVIGICTALERARWSVWDQQAYLLPRSYVDAVQRAGGLPCCSRPTRRRRTDPDALLDLLDGLILAGGADIDPATYGAQAHSETRGTVPERDDFEIALDPPRAGARPAAAGHLPRDAADERRRRRHAAAAPAREPRPPRAPPQSGQLRRRRPRRAPQRRLAGRARRGRGSCTPPSAITTRRVDRIGDGLEVTGWSAIDELPEASRRPIGASRWASSGTRRPTRPAASSPRS